METKAHQLEKHRHIRTHGPFVEHLGPDNSMGLGSFFSPHLSVWVSFGDVYKSKFNFQSLTHL